MDKRHTVFIKKNALVSSSFHVGNKRRHNKHYRNVRIMQKCQQFLFVFLEMKIVYIKTQPSI